MAGAEAPPAPSAEPAPARSLDSEAGAPSRRGIGLLVAMPLLTLGALSLASDRRCREAGGGSNCWGGLGAAINLPLAVVGFAVGIPLLAVGAHRHRLWKRSQITLRPEFGRALGGWTAGFVLHF